MKESPEKVYQLHISLKYIKPEIWRRFLVTDDITLEKLHKIIQEVMGWEEEHLHEFSIGGTKYGMRLDDDDYFFELEHENEKKFRLGKLNLTEEQKFGYLYDFGDGWEHEITVEKILPVEKGVKYPICLAGEMACAPEDCGSVPGYKQLRELSRTPQEKLGEDDRVRLGWLYGWYGDDFDFDYFSVDETNLVLRKLFAR